MNKVDFVGEFRSFKTGTDKTIDAGLVFLCGHCQNLFEQPRGLINDHRIEGAGFCHHCQRNVCVNCARAGKCRPYEELLENIERDRLRRRLWEQL